MPEPQSKASNWAAVVGVLVVSCKGAPVSPVPAVTYLPVAVSRRAMRSTPSLVVTPVPSFVAMPCAGVTA